ncbi:MAG: palindromic element RPE4 domain-containing protein [Gammaproteobacteria bacterium]|nr:palindromic element RPE4 domain-containing protein [Gammaproteobacteria bacterium]
MGLFYTQQSSRGLTTGSISLMVKSPSTLLDTAVKSRYDDIRFCSRFVMPGIFT